MRNEHEQEAGFQREVSTNRSASRSWEHDRDTLHRNGFGRSTTSTPSSAGTRRRTSPPTTARPPTRSLERALVRFKYHFGLSRAGKGLVREFLAKVTGYSDGQLSRLIAQQHRTGHIRDHRLRPPSRPFATVYTTADALLLAEVDEALGQLSGPATKRALWRMYHVFGDKRFERLAGGCRVPHLDPRARLVAGSCRVRTGPAGADSTPPTAAKTLPGGISSTGATPVPRGTRDTPRAASPRTTRGPKGGVAPVISTAPRLSRKGKRGDL